MGKLSEITQKRKLEALWSYFSSQNSP